MIQALLAGIARLVNRRPRAVLVVLGLVTAIACALLPRLEVDPDVTAFLPRGDPLVELLSNDQVAGAAGRRLWIALEGKGVGDKLAALAVDLGALPGVQRVVVKRGELLGASQLPHLGQLSETALLALENQLQPPQRRAAVLDIRRTLAEDPIGGQERVLRDPLGLRWALENPVQELPLHLELGSPYFLLEGGEVAILALDGEREPFDVEFSTALMNGTEELLAEHGFVSGSSAHILGGFAAARGDAARIRSDLTRSLLWSIPLVVFFLMLSARSFLLPHLYLAPVLIAVVWALGFGGALLGPLTPLALSSAAILTGIGVDFALHLAERWREERARGSAQQATTVTTIRTGRGLLAGMLTSSAAFLSFSTSSLPGLVSFGLLLTLGLVSAFLVTLFLEPLLLARYAGASNPPKTAATHGLVVGAARALRGRPSGHLLALALLLTSVVGWCLVGTRGLVFDADPSALRPADTFVTRAQGAISKLLSFSPIAVRVLVPAHAQRNDMDSLTRSSNQLRESGLAALVVGPQDSLPSTTKLALLDRLKTHADTLVEETARDLTEAGLRPEAFLASLEDLAQRLREPPRTDAPEFRVDLADQELDTQAASHWWRLDVYPRGDLAQRSQRQALKTSLLNAFGEDAQIVDPHGIGDLVTPILRRELLVAVRAAAVLMFVLVVLSLGGLRRGLLATLPVLMGFGLTLGLLSVFGIALTPGNLMAIPLVLGLGVDDGVHLVLCRAEGGDPLGSTGNAIWRTSATTALGFGSLITAQTPAISSLGAITLIGVAATMLTSLIVLPALWSRADRRARKGV